MREQLPEFTRRRVRVGCVVQGTAEEMARFCGRHGVEAVCIPDPMRASYRTMGLERTTWWNILFPSQEGKRRRAAAKVAGCSVSIEGTMQKHSDILQLPGAALIAKGGKIEWLYRGSSPSDLPSPADLLSRIAAERAGQ
ncbi:MAG TPA: AhpC/TSA family protein [Candidatus Nitrosotalea sp.]|nr:AhpC/TSA family protein [Candidatus Nitrosotalea sp.]